MCINDKRFPGETSASATAQHLAAAGSNYISWRFHLIPLRAAAGDISVTSGSSKSFCDRKHWLSPCGSTGTWQHKQRCCRVSPREGQALRTDRSPTPLQALLWDGSRAIACCHQNQHLQDQCFPQALSNFMCLQLQQRHIAPTPFSPWGQPVIEYLFKSAFDYLSENKTP